MNQTTEQKTQRNVAAGQGGFYTMASLTGLVLVLVVCSILFAREIILSLKDYTVFQGIMNSPWVGMQNFIGVFSSFAFTRVMQNTIIFNLLFSLMYFLTAAAAGYIIMAIPRGGREIPVLLCALAVFMPAEVYTSWLIHLLGSGIFVNPEAMRLFHPFVSTIKYLGISIMVMYIHNDIYVEKDPLLPIKVAGLFSLASLIFITHSFYSITNSLYNPLTYATMDMVDTYAFRKGFMEMAVGESTAVGVIKTVITLLMAALLFVPLLRLIRSIFKGERSETVSSNIRGRLTSAVISFVIFAVVYFLPYFIKGRSFAAGQLGGSINLGYPIIIYVILSAVSAAIATLIAALLSGAFISLNKNIKIAAGILLTLITILTIRPAGFSTYLLIRELGAMDTGFAIILSTGFSAAAVWATIYMMRSEHKISSDTVLISMLGLFLIQTALVYGNVVPQLVYLRRIEFAPLLIFRQLHTGMQAIGNVDGRASAYGVIGLYGFIIALPSLLLFLLANILLPKHKLLAIISAGTRN